MVTLPESRHKGFPVREQTQEQQEMQGILDRILDDPMVSKLHGIQARSHPQVAAHSQRIGVSLYMFALQRGLPENIALLAGRAGTIHDIGKIAMPEDILYKPSGLTQDEYLTMQQHVITGVAIVGANTTDLGSLIMAAMMGGHHLTPQPKKTPYPDIEALDMVIPYSMLVGAFPWIVDIQRAMSALDQADAQLARRSYSDPKTDEEVLHHMIEEKVFAPNDLQSLIAIRRKVSDANLPLPVAA